VAVVPTQQEIKDLKQALALLDKAASMDILECVMDDGLTEEQAGELYMRVLGALQHRSRS
jgi:hypothetical protein